MHAPIDAVVVQGGDNLTEYKFGNGTLAKTFCKVCGVHMTNEVRDASDKAEQVLRKSAEVTAERIRLTSLIAVNVRVLNGIELKDLKTPDRATKAATVEPLYVNP